MTHKEYLEKLTIEELVKTRFFVDCPYGYIYKQMQEKNGTPICEKDKQLANLKDSKEIAEFVFSGKQKKICNECKLRWLDEEYQCTND